MKPFLNCPNCGSILDIANPWGTRSVIRSEKHCIDHCEMEFYQYYDGDFTSDKLKYISLYTNHFLLSVYFDNGYYPNMTHIYSRHELVNNGIAGPILILKTEKIMKIISEMTREQILQLDDKLQTLVLFT